MVQVIYLGDGPDIYTGQEVVANGQRKRARARAVALIWVDDICLAGKMIRQPATIQSVSPPSTTSPSTWTATTPSRYVHIHPHPSLPDTPRCKGLAQVTASLHTIRVRVAPSTHRARPPCLYIRPYILFFNVGSPIFVRSRYSWDSSIFLTASQKTASQSGKLPSRHSRASSAVLAWLPFSVL